MNRSKEFFAKLDQSPDELRSTQIAEKYNLPNPGAVVNWLHAGKIDGRANGGIFLIKDNDRLKSKIADYKEKMAARKQRAAKKGEEESPYFDPHDKESYRENEYWMTQYNNEAGHTQTETSKYHDAFGNFVGKRSAKKQKSD